MNIFSGKQRASFHTGRGLTDRLFGKEISNLSRTRQPSLNRSLASDRPAPSKKVQTSCHITSSLLLQPARLNTYNFQDLHLQAVAQDIQRYLLVAEVDRPTSLFECQSEVNQSMRGVLIDWLVEVHYKMKLAPETLFLVVQMVDVFLSSRQVKKPKLQLLGVACLYLAAKYQETYRVPSLKDLIYLSANSYSKQDILEMELSLLEVLDFSVKKTTALSFVHLYSRLSSLQQKDQCLAQYLCELSLLESKFNEHKNSTIAASAVYLINKIRGRAAQHNEMLLQESGKTELEVRGCAKSLCQLMQSCESKSFTKSLRKKFASLQFCQVSRIKIQRKNQ